MSQSENTETEWLILIPDFRGTLETRMKVRHIHLEQLARHVDSGLFQMGGATLREPPAKTDDKLNVSGSAIIARARSAEDVLEVLRQDVYVKEGVWNMDEMQIFPRVPSGLSPSLPFKPLANSPVVPFNDQIPDMSEFPSAIAITQRQNELISSKVTLPGLQAHQVYVNIEWAAFNPTDRLAFDLNAFGDGAVLGCDFVGTVAQVHPSVTKLAVGDRIAALIWGGENRNVGAYSTCCIADERLSFKVPDSLSHTKAAAIPLAANTAYLALFSQDCLGLDRSPSSSKPGLLVWGGSSAVGYFAIQFAKLHGYLVATTCSPRNFEYVKKAGATYAFDYHSPDIIARLRDALPTASHIFDTIGNTESSATAAVALNNRPGKLCTVRPGKANTERVPSNIEVTDVFVFSAFPTAHTYRGSVHWPVNIPNHQLSAEFFQKIPGWLRNGSVVPQPVKVLGQLSPTTVKEAMHLNRTGNVSAEKLCFEVPHGRHT